jgi:hypothetical protein
MRPEATRPTTMKKPRCQPGWSANREKAAPVLWTWTRLKKLVRGMTSW